MLAFIISISPHDALARSGRFWSQRKAGNINLDAKAKVRGPKSFAFGAFLCLAIVLCGTLESSLSLKTDFLCTGKRNKSEVHRSP